MTTLTIGRISISLVEPTRRAAPAKTLRARLARWIRLERTQAELAGAEPRMRADAGAPVAAQDPALAAFALPPEALWNIGLTPQPRSSGARKAPEVPFLRLD